MASELEHFREVWDERWTGLRREIALREQALNVSAVDMDRRLAGMNEFRSQIEKERGAYLTRDMYDREHQVLEKRVAALEISRGGFAGGWQVIVVLIALGTLAVLYFKH